MSNFDIFTCPKDEEWHKNNPNGVADFWVAIRDEKMEKGDHDFIKFIFPAFEAYDLLKDANFWKSGEEATFSGGANFW